jgi:hypothetical protein
VSSDMVDSGLLVLFTSDESVDTMKELTDTIDEIMGLKTSGVANLIILRLLGSLDSLWRGSEKELNLISRLISTFCGKRN